MKILLGLRRKIAKLNFDIIDNLIHTKNFVIFWLPF